MVFQDPYFHAQQRQREAFRYEQARRQLAATLAERARSFRGQGPPELSEAEREERQRWVIEDGLDLYLPLLRYIVRRIDRHVKEALVEPGELAPEELAVDTYQLALQRVLELPQRPELFDWLRQLAREVVRTAALQCHAQRHEAQPVTEPQPAPAAAVAGMLKELIDALARPDTPLPDDVLAHPDLRRALDPVLARLPERWQEMFLLSALDRWPDDRIAAVEGLLPDEVRAIVRASSLFLRDWLLEELREAGT